MTGGKALPKEIADQIIDRTDGVPLFIEELTKSVVESGLVTDSRRPLRGGRAGGALGDTNDAACLVACAARSIGADARGGADRRGARALILARADQRGGQMPQHKLDEALEQLVGAELIFRRGTPPDAEYTFKHALVQDAAYNTLLRSRRQQLHARIADDSGSAVPRDRGDAARSAGATLRGSGPDREGGRLLAQGGSAGDCAGGDD